MSASLLRAWLAKERISHGKLAGKLGVSATIVGHWARGVAPIPPARRPQIENVLGLPAGSLGAPPPMVTDPRATRMVLELWLLDDGPTHEDLAIRLQVNSSAIRGWVSGRDRVPPGRYAAIEAAFGRDPGSFESAARAIQQAAEVAA